jgi:phenylacetate-coenzyme A ligase PaaK-like adenylate-forming protein
VKISELKNKIFGINSVSDFNGIALEIFHYQYLRNKVYHDFVDLLNPGLKNPEQVSEIPFLPVELFKTQKIYSSDHEPEIQFLSSGTTGSNKSTHYIAEIALYEKSFLTSFEIFYGDPRQYVILALLPLGTEGQDSSLIYMADKLIRISENVKSGFYFEKTKELNFLLQQSGEQKIILLGVSYALLDITLNNSLNNPNLIVMETGGMKGRRKEMVREELQSVLKSKFNVMNIHSEYGMTELLSQAYSKGDGIFRTPPWMKILIRDTNDPKTLLGYGKTGGINVIDLANLYSCSFISTQDLGKTREDGSFEVLGRFDNSDIRGCNLLVI